MVLTKQTYNNQEKYKKPKDIHKKPQKLNLTKPNWLWFSRLLRHPARKQIGHILTKKTTAPGARTGLLITVTAAEYPPVCTGGYSAAVTFCFYTRNTNMWIVFFKPLKGPADPPSSQISTCGPWSDKNRARVFSSICNSLMTFSTSPTAHDISLTWSP